MQCVHPACVSACTVGALRKTAEGPVVYDSSKCFGCRYCQYACPFNVPTYQWDDTFGLIQKCQMCYQRLATGQQPACVAACPNGALKFGNRADLLAQAHATIDANQGHYLDHVYGEHEVGGTSMLYLSAVPFDQLGLPVRDDSPSPHYAEAVMQMTPVVALSVASLATGLHLILRRRHMLAEQHAAEATQQQTKGSSHDR
jgi:formate dehydrogenase iron-sulfur subunit